MPQNCRRSASRIWSAEPSVQSHTQHQAQKIRNRSSHQYTGKADPELLALGSRLLHTEEQNIQQMKRFL